MKRKRACFIGKPNVGKSSLFNALTHANEHTGNWTGKTVKNAEKTFVYQDTLWEVVDLPGTYSLIYESEEEKVASDFVFQGIYDVAIVVCDASNLERSIAILFEVMDVTSKVILCVNLMDEAKKMKISIDEELLKKRISIPTIFMSVKERKGLKELCDTMNHYDESILQEVVHNSRITHYLEWMKRVNPLFRVGHAIHMLWDRNLKETVSFSEKERHIFSYYQHSIGKMDIALSYQSYAKNLLDGVVDRKEMKEKKEDKFLNFLFTNRFTWFFTVLVFLFFILWLTIYFSNIPSDLLFSFFESLERPLYQFFSFLPTNVLEPFIFGGYRTLYWVLSVMTPPMLIFFPLFSLLEDYGILPRIAFLLDKPFSKCGSCGKQSLTMCMGLGCNAVGVTGTRIMESKKMRVLASLTNVFMPCNGRFPAMICVIEMFLVPDTTIKGSFFSALILTGVILFGILLTLLVTKILNYFLKSKDEGMFLLELPTFRKPKIFKTIVSSIKDKAFDVLKRAMVISFPAGLLLYFASNIFIGDTSIFGWLIRIFEPFGAFLGVDGVILLSFLFGLPANEIVIPVMLQGYLNASSLVSYESIGMLKGILISHGWTMQLALCFLILLLCHFPCATTLLTIKKETNSWFYTGVAFLLPTLLGFLLCFFVSLLF